MKNYITGIITGISLTASAVMFMGAKMQDDVIVAKRISVVDENGTPTIILDGETGGISAMELNIFGFNEDGILKEGAFIEVKNGSGFLGLLQGGEIIVKGKDTSENVYISSSTVRIGGRDEKSTRTYIHSNGISIESKKSKSSAVYLGLLDDEISGAISINNLKGERTIVLTSDITGGGGIELFNGKGNRAAYLGSNTDEDGLIKLYDRYGDDGWAQTGKK